MPEENEKRLGADIPEELWFELNQKVPWGVKKRVYTALTRQLLDLLDESNNPEIVLGMIVNDDITVKDLVKEQIKDGTS